MAEFCTNSIQNGLKSSEYTERKVCMQRTTIRGRRLTACAAAAVLAAMSFAGGAFPLSASAAGGPQYRYSVLAGGNRIGMNVYIDAPGTISNVSVNDMNWEDYDVTGSGIVVMLSVSAAEMQKQFDISFLLDGQTYTKEGISTCQYLQDLQADSTAAQYHDAAKAMLDYGYAAESYFSDAAADFTAYGMTAAPDFSRVTVSGSKFTGKDAYNADLEAKDLPYRYYGMNLALLDEIKFSLYYETDSEAGEQALAEGSFGDTRARTEEAGAGFTRVWRWVPASKLTDTFSFANAPADPVDFSPAQYLAAAAAGEDAALANVCKALYAYGEAVSNVQTSQPEITWNYGYATRYDPSDEGGCANLDQFAADHSLATCAVSEAVYAHGGMAGAYLEIVNVNNGKTLKALVSNRDGNSQMADGDLDFLDTDFAKIKDDTGERADIKWRVIPLETNDPVIFRFKSGSTVWWSEVQIQNHRYPIAKLEVKKNGSYVVAERQGDYNFFLAANESEGVPHLDETGSYQFRITDINGNVIEETVNIDLSSALNEDVYFTGTQQFPA